jgi:nucleoside-diphosphate-sugar epimerase
MNIFVTGASGYIGGAVAHRLLQLGHSVTGLTRTEATAQLLRQRGIEPIIGSLDDAAVLTSAAQEADAVIHAASADHEPSVHTLVAALERSGKLLIHTSGSAIVADDACGEYASEKVFSDDDYFEPVPFRRQRVEMNRHVREAAIDKGVRGVVICPSMIYGVGAGLKQESEQIPRMTAISAQVGAGIYVGKGLNRYSNVHIDDLVDLYLLVLEKAPGGSFYFAENGHASFLEIARLISDSLGLGGKTQSLDVDYVTSNLGEAARYGAASNSRVSAVNARRLGWSPSRPSLVEDFLGTRST